MAIISEITSRAFLNNALMVVFSALFLKLIITLIYRLTFHPLAKYPGPWLAKVSDLYGAYHNGKGQLHVQSKIDHEKYGPVLRQGPNKLIFNTVTAMHEIYSTKDHVQKSFAYEMLVPKKGQYNIFTAIDKDIHRHKRKMLNQGFSDVNMKKFEPAMLQHIDIFVQNLMTGCDDQGSKWSTPFNMTRCSGHLQYDVMGKFGFGQSFEMQKKPDNHFLLDVVDAICLRGGMYVQYPRLRYLIIDKLLAWRTSVLRSKYAALITHLVQARYATEKDSQSDLYSTLSDVTNPENGLSFSDEELWTESRFLLIAGADTSRTALSAAFFYLTAYPKCYEELIAEIRSTFTSAEEIKSGPKLASCHYLRACIDEMLRMSCPISGTLWREVCAGGITVDGEHIPASTDIGVNPYAIFHNEDVFPSSSIFMPERWIVSEYNPQANVDQARHAFQPFSLGPRSCAGRTMAYMELSNTIAKTCWYMDFKRAEGPMGLVSAGVKGGPKGRDNEKEFQLLEHVTCTHNGPYLQFRLRDGMKKELVIHRV